MALAIKLDLSFMVLCFQTDPPPQAPEAWQWRRDLLQSCCSCHTLLESQRGLNVSAAPLGIQMICGYRGKMREALVKVKQPTSKLDKKGVVYEVPCGEYNLCASVKWEELWGSDSPNTGRQWRNVTRRMTLLCTPGSPDTKWSGSLPKEGRKLHQTSPTEGLWKLYLSTGHRTRQTWTAA